MKMENEEERNGKSMKGLKDICFWWNTKHLAIYCVFVYGIISEAGLRGSSAAFLHLQFNYST